MTKSAVKQKMRVDASVSQKSPLRIPFKEQPFDRYNKSADGKLSGIELFSLFTADIIKQEVVFTR